MSNYTKLTNFAVKDTLANGDPNKVIRGTDLDAEFQAIASASSTKTDDATLAPVAKSGKYTDLTNIPTAFNPVIATATTLGGVKQGTGNTIGADGTLTINFPAAPVTSVAGKTGDITISNTDISGLGTAATKNVGTSASSVVQLDANAKLPAVDGSQLIGVIPSSLCNYQSFTANGTWTKPVGSTFVFVRVVGGGGGGGGGCTTTSNIFGAGSGGSGSLCVEQLLRATDLANTVSVTIGAGGGGGAAGVGNGSNGTNGGNSVFGTVNASGGLGGAKGNATTAPSTTYVGGIPGFGTSVNSNAGSLSWFCIASGSGGGAGTSAGPGFNGGCGGNGPGGGGGGGAAPNSATIINGGQGGLGWAYKSGVAIPTSLALGLGGLAGTSGAPNGANAVNRGDGGGGGCGSYSVNSGSGGNGYMGGGGGGGGGCYSNSYIAGAGGNGGSGFVEVFAW